jgi:hypothetical protein
MEEVLDVMTRLKSAASWRISETVLRGTRGSLSQLP